MSPVNPENEIEAIAVAWMRHYGYTDEQIEAAAVQSCRDTGCEPVLVGGDPGPHTSFDCMSEDGKSRHPIRDHLDAACDFANVAIEALATFARSRDKEVH